MDFQTIRKYIQLLFEEKLDELEVKQSGKTVFLRREGARREAVVLPSEVSGVSEIPPAPEEKEEEIKGEYITSPMVGTFYRTPSPKEDPFVAEGQTVDAGQTLCLIEAMKHFNEIKCEEPCTILKVLVESGQSVEHGQPLFLVETI